MIGKWPQLNKEINFVRIQSLYDLNIFYFDKNKIILVSSVQQCDTCNNVYIAPGGRQKYDG